MDGVCDVDVLDVVNVLNDGVGDVDAVHSVDVVVGGGRCEWRRCCLDVGVVDADDPDHACERVSHHVDADVSGLS